MAQEVAQIIPDAVVRGADGFLRVTYARLGMRLLTWDEWAAKSRRQATAGERKCPVTGVACDLVVSSSRERRTRPHLLQIGDKPPRHHVRVGSACATLCKYGRLLDHFEGDLAHVTHEMGSRVSPVADYTELRPVGC